jgi:hypothetical protein
MLYETEHIKNLFTGKPFVLEVSPKNMAQFQRVKEMIRLGKIKPDTSEEELLMIWELSFFPSYQEILKIFFENGYSDELMSKILRDFGVPDDFAQKLIEDKEFIEGLKDWFEGITWDGERASRTLKLVYDAVSEYFSVK